MSHESDLAEVMEILENMEDEQLAVQLLKDLNIKTKKLGQLLLNLDPELSHKSWENQCDLAKNDVDDLIASIKAKK